MPAFEELSVQQQIEFLGKELVRKVAWDDIMIRQGKLDCEYARRSLHGLQCVMRSLQKLKGFDQQ